MGVGVGKGTKAIHPAKQQLIGKPRFHDIFTILLSMLKKTPTRQLLVRFATQVNSTTGFSGKRKNGESTSILDFRRPIASD